MSDQGDAAAAAAPPGGLGGASAPGIRDTRLVERALRESWPIPDEIRGPLMVRLARIALDRDSKPREATAAARALLSASKLNLETITAAIKAREHEELLGRVEELERRIRDQGDHS